MNKSITIWQCDSETALRLKILAVNKGITIGKILEELVNERWDKEEPVANKKIGLKINKLARMWLRKLSN